MPNSVALQRINGAGPPAVNKIPLPTHVIGTEASLEQDRNTAIALKTAIFSAQSLPLLGPILSDTCPLLFPAVLQQETFRSIFSGPSDLIVSLRSQAADGLLTPGASATTLFFGKIHTVTPPFLFGPDVKRTDFNFSDFATVIDEDDSIVLEVIDLLNASVQSGGRFAPL